MNSRLVFIFVALLVCVSAVLATYADADPLVSLVEVDSEASMLAELEAEADAEMETEVDVEAEVDAEADAEFELEGAPVLSNATVPPVVADFKPTNAKSSQYTGGAIRPALIFDDHILSGTELKNANRQLKFFRVEPPAAVLPPIVNDVDDKIISMAYDLSFEKRPSAAKTERKKLTRGAKLLNAYAKMKKTLAWAMKKPGQKKGGAKKAAAPAKKAAAPAKKEEAKKFF